MASIKRRDDGKWRARYRDPDGKEHARHFARKVDAERWLDGVRGELVTGAYIDPNAGKLTLEEYAEEAHGAGPPHRHPSAGRWPLPAARLPDAR